jgi:glycosyltransferase involved in cell wall biosynthesis
VLHVLPHAGGGGETYVRALSRIEDYRAERITLAELPWRLRAHALLHVHGEAAAALCLPGLLLRPSVVTLHGLHLLRRLEGARRRLAVANLRLILRAASRVICVSQAEMTDLVDAVGVQAAGRAVVVLNGIEPARLPDAAERAEARKRLSIRDDAVAGVFVGALDEVKQPLVAAQAARQAGVTLLLAGAGPLQEKVQAAGDDILMLGKLDDVRPALAAADFFVLPSKREGLSFALLEAMSCGLAPVVSDGPGNPEAVGDAGLVVRSGDVEGFARAFARLRDDSAYRSQLSTKARSRVLQQFSAERMLRETKVVYDEVLRRLARR